jgi:hypothetical protein
MFRLGCRRSPAQFACAGRGWFQHASRLRGTRLEERYRKECGTSPAAVRRNGVRSAAGSYQCKSRHRGGNMPSSMVRYAMESWEVNHLRASRHEGTEQCRCLALAVGCYQGFPGARTSRQHLSCVQSFLALGQAPSPTVKVPVPHRIPCMHASMSWGSSRPA